MALSSTVPADFPLPRTALELGFDLIALRAPCRQERNGGVLFGQVLRDGVVCKLRQVLVLATARRSLGCRRGPRGSLDRRRRGLAGRGRAHGARRGGQPRRASQLAGVRARRRSGCDRALADLLLGASDPRPLARRLGLPEGARGVQPDVRRRAPSRDPGRGRRVLLARHLEAGGGVGGDAAHAPARDRRREDRLVRVRRDDPRRGRRARRRGPDRGAPRGAVADRARARVLCRPALDRRPAAAASGRWGT